MHKKSVDLRIVADVVLMLSRPLIGKKTLKLVNDIPSGLPPVHADENRLQQILHNLIGNAVKFTESGTVTISAETKTGKLYVKVADTGFGIPKEDFERIFDSFEQVDASISRIHGGVGLGLAVTKNLVDLHGGKIWVESKPGKGTTFIFSLPTFKEDTEIQGIKRKSSEVKSQLYKTFIVEPINEKAVSTFLPPAGSKNHILIVDDDPISRQVLLNILHLKNFTVTEASGGLEALRLLKENQHIDLVLLDIMMPGMSGYEVCREIRDHFNTNQLPVIFLTAKNQDSDLAEAFDVGGNDFITKPISKIELVKRIETQLRLLEINRTLEEKVKERTQELTLINADLEKKQEELKKLHTILVQSEKMAALGILTAGVAHQMNNPASFTGMAVHNLKTDLEEFEEYLKDVTGYDSDDETRAEFDRRFKTLLDRLKTITQGITRMSENVTKLLEFSRPANGELKRKKLVELLQLNIDFARGKYMDDVDFITDFQVSPELLCNEANLNNAFMNIIINGCQAIIQYRNKTGQRDKGKLTIQTLRENNEVVIKFHDTGNGMSEEVRQRIFDPFFTTKAEGEGTGLGLSTSYKIIKEHNGRIEANSEEGRGTSFIIYFPFENPDKKEVES